MPTRSAARRVSYAFLCFVPLLFIIVGAGRALRVPGAYQTIGGVLFAAIVVAVWLLGAREIGPTAEGARRKIALSGALLAVPFALFSLLWVGLGPPWEATPPENRMRYLVLLVGAIAVGGAFVILKEALSDAGERFHSTIGFAANMFAGAAYLGWMSFMLGMYVVRVAEEQPSPTIVTMSGVFDNMLTMACALTYIATAAFATSCGKAGWLSRGATSAYVIANCILLLFLVVRGVSFPDPAAGSTPWYLRPGLVAGIPAVPWIMPFLLGVVLLRRAGDRGP